MLISMVNIEYDVYQTTALCYQRTSFIWLLRTLCEDYITEKTQRKNNNLKNEILPLIILRENLSNRGCPG